MAALKPDGGSQGTTYKSLDKSRQEIRLLTLHAGITTSPIALTLEHTNTHDAGDYAALSYCWGTDSETENVLLDGQAVSIRRNLWDFLSSLRELKGTIKIWADYLCIRQDDHQERGHQVRLMADIYTNATDVYAWLGMATSDTDEACDYFEDLADRVRSPDGKTNNGMEYIISGRFDDIATRQYWTRVWIVQELLLARRIWVVVGGRMLSGRLLADMVVESCGYYHSTFTEIMFDRRMQLLPQQLTQLVSRYCDSRCQDPRDRLYGMLGLLAPNVREDILVDYEKPFLQICVDNLKHPVQPPTTVTVCSDGATTPLLVYDAVEVASKLFEIHGRDTTELVNLSRSMILRSHLRAEVAVRALLEVDLHKAHMFAALRQPGNAVEPLSEHNLSDTFAVYVSRLSDDADLPKGFLYTSVPLQNGDAILKLGPMSRAILRTTAKGYEVVDMACLDWTGHLNPRVWLESRITDGESKLLQINQPSTERGFGDSDKMCVISLDCLTIGEIVRTERFDGLRRPMRYRLAHWLCDITVPWNPEMFLQGAEPAPQNKHYSALKGLPENGAGYFQLSNNEWPWEVGLGYELSDRVPSVLLNSTSFPICNENREPRSHDDAV